MNFGGSNGHKDICILVVDCDPSCLVTISRMLRDLTYQVMTVGRTADALAITLEEDYQVDLVMTELHMPEMDGVKLLDEIQRTTKLPVVIMSTDDDEDAMLRSLNKGAMYYMIKPVEIENLKNLWQYVFLNRREKQLQRTRHNGHVRDESLGENEPAGSGLVTNHSKQHGYHEYTTDTEDTLTSAPRKKPKLVWTAELHNRFLFAVAELGLDNAHPKKILRIMGVKGLTKEQVSSHLQKYRVSVRRDRLAVNSGLELATRKTPIDHIGPSFSRYGNQSWHNFSHGIRAPHGLLAPTMASSQPGFTGYCNMQRNQTSSSNIRHGQYCNYNHPGAGHGVLNQQTAMDVNNGGRSRNGWDLFNDSIMLPPQPWMLPPPPPPPPPPQQGGQGTGDRTFAGVPEADAGFCKRYGGNQRFPK